MMPLLKNIILYSSYNDNNLYVEKKQFGYQTNPNKKFNSGSTTV